MKLQDLVEQQKVIEGDVRVPEGGRRNSLKGFNVDGVPIAGVIITGNFSCTNTNLRSLEGSPIEVRGRFICSGTKINSLEGGPAWVGKNYSATNTVITSLEGVASHIGGDLITYNTSIRSLHLVHKQIKYMGGDLILPNTVVSNVLGVILIKGLKKLEYILGDPAQQKVERIINKHLESDRDVHACQEELLEAGLKEYAKL